LGIDTLLLLSSLVLVVDQHSLSWGSIVFLSVLVELQETLDRVMELASELSLILLSIVHLVGGSLEIGSSVWWLLSCVVNALDGSGGLEVLVNLLLDLGKILANILVSSLESLLGKFSNLSVHHALLILEKAVRSTKEAVKGDNLLEESELGVGFVSVLRLNGLLDGGVNLGINFLFREGGKTGLELSSFLGGGESR